MIIVIAYSKINQREHQRRCPPLLRRAPLTWRIEPPAMVGCAFPMVMLSLGEEASGQSSVGLATRGKVKVTQKEGVRGPNSGLPSVVRGQGSWDSTFRRESRSPFYHLDSGLSYI